MYISNSGASTSTKKPSNVISIAVFAAFSRWQNKPYQVKNEESLSTTQRNRNIALRHGSSRQATSRSTRECIKPEDVGTALTDALTDIYLGSCGLCDIVDLDDSISKNCFGLWKSIIMNGIEKLPSVTKYKFGEIKRILSKREYVKDEARNLLNPQILECLVSEARKSVTLPTVKALKVQNPVSSVKQNETKKMRVGEAFYDGALEWSSIAHLFESCPVEGYVTPNTISSIHLQTLWQIVMEKTPDNTMPHDLMVIQDGLMGQEQPHKIIQILRRSIQRVWKLGEMFVSGEVEKQEALEGVAFNKLVVGGAIDCLWSMGFGLELTFLNILKTHKLLLEHMKAEEIENVVDACFCLKNCRDLLSRWKPCFADC